MSADCCMRAWVCGGGQRDVGGRGSDGYVCASDVWASCVHVVCACRCGLPHRRRGPRAFIAAGCWRVRVGRPAISRPVRSAPLGGASSSWWRGLGRARSPSSCCSWWSCSSDVCDGPSYPGTHLRCELCSGASGGGEPCANGLCAVAFLVAVWWVHSVCPVFCPLDNRPLTPRGRPRAQESEGRAARPSSPRGADILSEII